MNPDSKAIFAAALSRLLRPLVKLLLRNGIAYGAFAELAKKAYVDVAFNYHVGSSKRPTTSSVAALTGLTRKEVKRLRELEGAKTAIEDERYNRSTRVISGWLNDARYLGDDGQPKALSLDETDQSFNQLVKQYSGDIPASAMLSVLEAAVVVHVHKDKVHLLQHAFIPHGDPSDKINIMGTDVGELIGTIDHNLTSPPNELRFQRKVSNQRLRSTELSKFRNLSAQKAQKLLEELDRWLLNNEADVDHDDATHYVAMGIYFTEHPTHSDTPEDS